MASSQIKYLLRLCSTEGPETAGSNPYSTRNVISKIRRSSSTLSETNLLPLTLLSLSDLRKSVVLSRMTGLLYILWIPMKSIVPYLGRGLYGKQKLRDPHLHTSIALSWVSVTKATWETASADYQLEASTSQLTRTELAGWQALRAGNPSSWTRLRCGSTPATNDYIIS